MQQMSLKHPEYEHIGPNTKDARSRPHLDVQGKNSVNLEWKIGQ